MENRKLNFESLTSYSIPKSDFNRPVSTITKMSKRLTSSTLELCNCSEIT